MKARNLTVLAVVATGAVALGAPAAFASTPDVSGVDGGLAKLAQVGKAAKKNARASKSKSQERVDNDIKRLGNNVHDLRKEDDKINFTISSLVSTITPILTQLGAAATSYANFEYGVVQLYAAGDPIAGAFVATPRIDPTVEQSTVTAQFPCLPSVLGNCDSGEALTLKAAVRSADPTANDAKSTAKCRVQLSQQNTANWAASLQYQLASPTPFVDVPRSKLVPDDPKAESTFPAAFVSSDTNIVDMTAASRTINNAFAGAPPTGVGSITKSGAGGVMINVTLSCLAAPK